MLTKYEVSYGSKGIAKVEIGNRPTGRQTERTKNSFVSDHFIRRDQIQSLLRTDGLQVIFSSFLWACVFFTNSKTELSLRWHI